MHIVEGHQSIFPDLRSFRNTDNHNKSICTEKIVLQLFLSRWKCWVAWLRYCSKNLPVCFLLYLTSIVTVLKTWGHKKNSTCTYWDSCCSFLSRATWKVCFCEQDKYCSYMVIIFVMRTVRTKRYLIFGDFVEVSTCTVAQNRCGLLAYQMTMT